MKGKFMNPPCKKDGIDCQKRNLGCQTICPEFINYKNKLEEKKRILNQARSTDRLLCSYKNERKIKTCKYKKHK